MIADIARSLMWIERGFSHNWFYRILFIQYICLVILTIIIGIGVFGIFKAAWAGQPLAERRAQTMRPARIGLWISFFAFFLVLMGMVGAIQEYKAGTFQYEAFAQQNLNFFRNLIEPFSCGLYLLLIGIGQYYLIEFFSIWSWPGWARKGK